MKKRLAAIIIGAALALTMCITAFADETYTGVWNTPINMDEEIQFIRDTYNYTQAHKDEYYSRDMAENIPDDIDIYYVHDDAIVAGIMIDPEYTIEYYRVDPALGREQSWWGSLYDLVFMFGTDEAGNEYRLYMKDGVIIRYIGPDGSVHDYPYGLSPWDLESTCGTFAKKMLDTANPGWWGVD